MKSGSYCFYILLCFTIPAVCFQFRRTPTKPLVVYYRNRTNVEFRWDWTLESGEILTLLKIKRYRKNFANTETAIATYGSGSTVVDATKYSLTVNDVTNGYASFVIKDLTNQGQGIPYITTYPTNQTASGGTVTFACAAGGKPPPTITWEKIGSSQSFTTGSPLTLTNFAEDKIGVYKCTARSTGIVETATATGFVQFATCGSGCNKEEVGIEFTNLQYSSNDNYQELKNKIQTECLKAYALKNKIIRTCKVPRFRSGSLVAVVELGSPTNYVGDPKQPLLEAISDGSFAGYPVTNTFVSPIMPTVGSTQTPTRRLTRSSEVTGNSTTVPSEVAPTCSLVIGICVTIIILSLLSNAVLGFLLWSKSSQLKGLAKNRIQVDRTPYQHPDTAASNNAFITNRQPEEPTAPIYHEVFNNNDIANGNINQEYQTLHVISQQPCQTYQFLDNARKNAISP